MAEGQPSNVDIWLKRETLRTRILIPSFAVAGLMICPLVFCDDARGWQEIYETPIPAGIRRNFNDAVHTRNTCPECELGILDGENFLDMYAKKFIVVGMEPNSFGGVWALIAVEGNLRDAFRLWLYDVGDDEYDLRSIEKLPDFLEEEFVRQIRNPISQQYWF